MLGFLFWLCVFIGHEINPAVKNVPLEGAKEKDLILPQQKKGIFRIPKKFPTRLSAPDQFQINIILDNNPITMWVNSETKVERVKVNIKNENQGPPIYYHRLMFKENQLEDAQTMAEYGITGDKGETPEIHLIRDYGFAGYYLNPEYFDPQFDHDFREEKDDGTVLYRGKDVYERPYKSMRYAIKVLGKYSDDNWLNKPPKTKHSQSNWRNGKAFVGSTSKLFRGGERKQQGADDPQEGWPVAYHGTLDENAIAIVKEGFRLDKGEAFAYGEGIYTSPSPRTALSFAKISTFNGKKYKLIIQSRVDPSKVDKQWIGSIDGRDVWYWLLLDGAAIRPYGICVYEAVFNGVVCAFKRFHSWPLHRLRMEPLVII